MKALVTGGTGFVGSFLVDHLSRHGVDVYVLMRKTSSTQNLEGSKYTRIEGDITDLESLKKAVRGMDVVYHVAGAIKAVTAKDYYHHNKTGTENVARAMVDAGLIGKRLVYVSTLAAGGPADEVMIRNETHVDEPVSHYGKSKKAGEDALIPYREKLSIVTLRPPSVYGPKDPVSFMLVKAVSNKLVPVFGPKIYSIVHVVDFVQAIYLAGKIESDKIKSGEVFYICSGEVVPLKEWANEIAKVMGIKPIWLPVPQGVLFLPALVMTLVSRWTKKASVISVDKLNEAYPDRWVCDPQKAKDRLGFSPQISLQAGVRDAVEWYKKAGWI